MKYFRGYLGEVRVRADCAYGIGIAADSELDQVKIDAGGVSGIITPKRALGLSGQPLDFLIGESAYFPVTVGNSYLTSVCVAEHPWEVPLLQGGRAKRIYGRTYTATASGTQLVVPYYGRRHGVIWYDMNENGTILVEGLRTEIDTGTFDPTIVSIDVDGTTGSAYNIGGTNEEEEAEELRLTMTTDDASAWSGEIWVHVFGELGD